MDRHYPDFKRRFLKAKGRKIVLGFALLSSLLAFDFFVVERYHAYPWWHQFGWFGVNPNDTDAVYPAQTIALLNNSRATCVTHPGATYYTFHGLAYRLLSLTGERYGRFSRLQDVVNLQEASDILETATSTSRVLNLMTAVGLAAVLLALLHRLTSLWGVAFLFAFYVVFSPAFSRHLPVVRPELPSLVFLLSAMLICLRMADRKVGSLKAWAIGFVTTGFLLGLSVFSKVQATPLVAGFAVVVFFSVLKYGPRDDKKSGASLSSRSCLVIALGNLVIMPWWALRKPSFVTPYLKHNVHLRQLYGPMPESFWFPVMIVLLALALLAAIVFFAARKKDKGPWERISLACVSVNAIVSGLIASCYVIFLPVSGSLTRYVENTRNLVYAILTNLAYQGFLKKKVLDIHVFMETIGVMHGRNSRLLLLHVGLLVGVVVAATVVRLALKSTADKKRYALVLVFILAGLGMDILTTMRWHNIQDNYAIYSFVLYVLGMARWVGVEWTRPAVSPRAQKSLRAFRVGVVVLLGLHLIIGTGAILTKPRASGASDQDPTIEYINNQYWAPAFWEIIDERVGRGGAG